LCAALVLANGIRVAPQWRSSPTTSVPTAQALQLKCLLSNVHTENREFDRVLNFVQAERPDIAVFEEVDNEWFHHLYARTNILPHLHAIPRSDNFGIAVFSRFRPARIETEYFSDRELPSLVFHFGTELNHLTLIATHPLPPVFARGFEARNQHLAGLGAFAAKLPSPTIVVGDLNCSPWSPWFHQLEADSGLRDSTRGHGVQLSWPVGLPVIGVPIDHCLVSPSIQVIRRRLGPNVGSDHYPLVVELVLPPKP